MKHPTRPKPASQQRGVVLLFSLIALIVLLIAAVALMRSFNGSLFMSGNIAFKRDLQNQGERAMSKVLASFRTGGALATATARSNNVAGSNYSAKMLTANAQGVPEALWTDAKFLEVGKVANDIDGDSDASLAGQGVSIRYVVDRMCNDVGDETTLGSTACLLANDPPPVGTDMLGLAGGADSTSLGKNFKSAAAQGVVYRLTVRVTGPRFTQSFFQSTFTVPS